MTVLKFPTRRGDAKVYTTAQVAAMRSWAWSCGFLSAFGVVGICAVLVMAGAK